MTDVLVFLKSLQSVAGLGGISITNVTFVFLIPHFSQTLNKHKLFRLFVI